MEILPTELKPYQYFPSVNGGIFVWTSCIVNETQFHYSCVFECVQSRQKRFAVTLEFIDEISLAFGNPIFGTVCINETPCRNKHEFSKDIFSVTNSMKNKVDWTYAKNTLHYEFETLYAVRRNQFVFVEMVQPLLQPSFLLNVNTPLTATIKYFLYFDQQPGQDNQTIIRLYYSDFSLMPQNEQLNITYQLDSSTIEVPYTPFYNGRTGDSFGSIGPGNDQYGIYYRVGNVSESDQSVQARTRISPINMSSYISYDYDNPKNNITFNGNNPLFDYAVDQQSVSNPFLPGNTATNGYGEVSNSINDTRGTNYLDPSYASAPTLQFQYVNQDTGQQGVFRLDKQSTQFITNHLDGGGLDPCLSTYLACPGVGAEIETQNLTCGILRVKVPFTYSPLLNSDTVQKQYNVQYFSLGFHVKYQPFPDVASLPGFWTVNGSMLQKLQDKDGYAYLFYIRNDLWPSYMIDNPNFDFKQKTPPIVTWGQYTGYLCGQPTYAIIMRYKEADPKWVGNPINATCYDTPAENEPIPSTSLGGFVPEVYNLTADQEGQVSSWSDFESLPSIGAVTKNEPWPVSS